MDRHWLVERHCEHGMGHPDPDSVRWLESHGYDVGGSLHGCCAERCCIPPEKKVTEIVTDVPTEYRGVPVPPRLRQYWAKTSGRYWRKGVDAKADISAIEVLPGQVYADGDYRRSGRTLRVDRITKDGLYAVCTVLTNYSHVQECLDKGWAQYQDMRGLETVIRTRRLYPNARGYRLVQPEKSAA